jgi:hypothetical protein
MSHAFSATMTMTTGAASQIKSTLYPVGSLSDRIPVGHDLGSATAVRDAPLCRSPGLEPEIRLAALATG